MRYLFKHGLMFLCLILARMRGLKQYPAILMYHSFDSEGWKYGVGPHELERQLKYLAENYSFVNLQKIVEYTENKINLPHNAIAITIDDGYQDTYDVFFPIAKKLNIPFTLFLTTDLSEKPNLGNLPRPTENMICEMFNSGLMGIGLHGHTHMHFDTAMKEGAWDREVVESSEYLCKLLGVAPTTMAYPSGRYNDEVLEYFRTSSQYIAGVSIRSGFVRPGDDPFLLKRIEVSRNVSSFLLFKMRLTPALDIYNSIITLIKK